MGDQEPFNRLELIYRVGTFFIVVATCLLIYFLFSESVNSPEISAFCWSTVLYILGFVFRAQYKKAVKPSGRFGIFKRFKKGSTETKNKTESKDNKES